MTKENNLDYIPDRREREKAERIKEGEIMRELQKLFGDDFKFPEYAYKHLVSMGVIWIYENFYKLIKQGKANERDLKEYIEALMGWRDKDKQEDNDSFIRRWNVKLIDND